MKPIIIIAFLLFANTVLHAQDTVRAQVKGGQNAWISFLERNIHPQVPADNGAKPGRYVITLDFLVDSTGKMSDVQVLQDPGYGIAEDALNAFKHCPSWKPATVNNNPITYRQKQNLVYNVPGQ